MQDVEGADEYRDSLLPHPSLRQAGTGRGEGVTCQVQGPGCVPAKQGFRMQSAGSMVSFSEAGA